MLTDILLPSESQLRLNAINVEEQMIVIDAESNQPQGICRHCQTPSERVHSWYHRQPADLPIAGVAVCLSLSVRRFFCDNTSCQYTTFSETIPGIVSPYAHRTQRQAIHLTVAAFELGGEAGARLLGVLGMPTSPDTLLRLIRNAPEPEIKTPRVLGVDDWAKRKGHSYGTILVDLETHQPVDLLEDRKAETLAQWLITHPGVEVISRDRSGEYRKGATDGAPLATQVADRWHLLKNLRETLERLLENKEHCLRAAAETDPAEPSIPEKPPPASVETPETSLTTNHQTRAHQFQEEREQPEDETVNSQEPGTAQPDQHTMTEKTPQKPETTDDRPPLMGSPDATEKLTVALKKKRAVHERRRERYQMVCSLHQQGLSCREIARRTKLGRRTVSQYINATQCPQYPTGVKRTSKLDPYMGVIRQRIVAGCHNAKTIFHELRKMGFDGSYELVARFCKNVAGRKSARASANGSPQHQAEILPWSARRASWILCKPEASLTPEEQSALERIQSSDEGVAKAHRLGQRFSGMILKQEASELIPWLSDVAKSGIDTLKRFADGIQQDLTAVTNALSLPWSQGQVEGQVNRLKLIKRQMYGRAKFDLLRKRVLGCPTPA